MDLYLTQSLSEWSSTRLGEKIWSQVWREKRKSEVLLRQVGLVGALTHGKVQWLGFIMTRIPKLLYSHGVGSSP